MRRRKRSFLDDTSTNIADSYPSFSSGKVSIKEWSCLSCTLLNSYRRRKCEACKTRRVSVPTKVERLKQNRNGNVDDKESTVKSSNPSKAQSLKPDANMEKDEDDEDEDCKEIIFKEVDPVAHEKAVLSVEKRLEWEEKLQQSLPKPLKSESFVEMGIDTTRDYHQLPQIDTRLQQPQHTHPLSSLSTMRDDKKTTDPDQDQTMAPMNDISMEECLDKRNEISESLLTTPLQFEHCDQMGDGAMHSILFSQSGASQQEHRQTPHTSSHSMLLHDLVETQPAFSQSFGGMSQTQPMVSTTLGTSQTQYSRTPFSPESRVCMPMTQAMSSSFEYNVWMSQTQFQSPSYFSSPSRSNNLFTKMQEAFIPNVFSNTNKILFDKKEKDSSPRLMSCVNHTENVNNMDNSKVLKYDQDEANYSISKESSSCTNHHSLLNQNDCTMIVQTRSLPSTSLFCDAGLGKSLEVLSEAQALTDNNQPPHAQKRDDQETNYSRMKSNHNVVVCALTNTVSATAAIVSLASHHNLFTKAGSGRMLEVSDEAIEKADEILQRGSEICKPPGAQRSSCNAVDVAYTNAAVSSSSRAAAPSASYTSFTKAGSGRVVEVSDEALAKAEEILQRESFVNHPLHAENHILPVNSRRVSASVARAPAPSALYASFTKAGSGRVVEVSDEALAKAEEILQRESEIYNPPGAQRSSCNAVDVAYTNAAVSSGSRAQALAPSASYTSFTKAGSGRVVEVSDEALAKAEEFLQRGSDIYKLPGAQKSSFDAIDVAYTNAAVSSNLRAPAPSALYTSFTKAGSGRVVEVSDEALAKAEEILQRESSLNRPLHAENSILQVNSRSVSAVSRAAAPAPSALYTSFTKAGSGRVLEVSDEALLKADEMLWPLSVSHQPPGAHQGNTLAYDHISANKSSYNAVNDACTDATASYVSRALSFMFTPSVKVNSGFVLKASNEPHAKAGELPLSSDMHKPAPTAYDPTGIIDQSNNHSKDDPMKISHEVIFSRTSESFCQSELGRGMTTINEESCKTVDSVDHLGYKRQNSGDFLNHSNMKTPYDHAKDIRCIKSNVVTRSTGLVNPYRRKRQHDETLDTVTSCQSTIRSRPSVSFYFTTNASHESPTNSVYMDNVFILDDATSVIEAVSKCREQSSTGNPSTSFHFSPFGKKIKLYEFAHRYGPMTSDESCCIKLGVRSIVMKISADNASKLRFDCNGLPHSFLGEKIRDHVNLCGGVVDLRNQLLQRGCLNSIISDMWLNNHYRWICWKLAAMERRFPRLLAGKYLTYEHVISQLCQRYNQEYGAGKRSILKRILNRDLTSSQSMILCVSKIMKREKVTETNTKIVNVSVIPKADECIIELTDGWYSISAIMDDFLQDRVRKGKIAVGSKLMISNAVLEGAEDGIDPLDPKYFSAMRSLSVRLKICANSTRLSKWTAKLGQVWTNHVPYGGLYRIKSLIDVVRGGGSIPLIFLVICKRYPILFMEQSGSRGSDACKIRSMEEEEYRAQMQQKRLDRFIDDITEEAQRSATKDVEDAAPTSWKLMMSAAQPEVYYASLSHSERVIIDQWDESYPRLIQEKASRIIELSLQSNPDMVRASTRFVRLLVQAYSSNSNNRKLETRNQAVITVWNVSDEQLEILTEGNVIAVKQLGVKESLHDGLLQLSAGSWTHLELLSPQPGLDILKNCGFLSRESKSLLHVYLTSVGISDNCSIVYPEYDVIGYLLHVTEDRGHISLYLTDDSGVIVRIDRQVDVQESRVAMSQVEVMKRNTEMGVHTILSLQNIRIMPLETSSKCAIGLWTQSSFQSKEKSDRHQLILTWAQSMSGTQICNSLRIQLKARIPINGSLPPKYAIALGYITEIQNHVYSKNMWRCFINCMGTMSFEVNFPFHLLDPLLCLYGDERIDPETLPDAHHWSKFLSELVHKNEVLIHFNLEVDKIGDYQVVSIHEADLLVYSRLLITD